MENKLFESILKEAKDYKFKAKVGDFWLQKDGEGWRLCDDKAEADEFESETEPRQIINQMQKDGEIEETSKVEIVKVKESVNLFNKILKEASFTIGEFCRNNNIEDSKAFIDFLKKLWGFNHIELWTQSDNDSLERALDKYRLLK